MKLVIGKGYNKMDGQQNKKKLIIGSYTQERGPVPVAARSKV